MMNKTVTAFSKLNYYYEEGRTLFRSPGWCLFKLDNSELTLSGFGIEIVLYSRLLDFKLFSSGLREFQVFLVRSFEVRSPPTPLYSISTTIFCFVSRSNYYNIEPS